jgi:two-component system nitrogen regulation sensor histidine kinase NtrY
LYSDVPFELDVQVPENDVQSFVDPEQIGRVLNNLIKNAKQAVADVENPRVRVGLRSEFNQAIITVLDNGSGIVDHLKDKIFRPSFTTKSSGTGLGLSICKQIVEGAGGTISFESTAEEGTEFKVILPQIRD